MGRSVLALAGAGLLANVAQASSATATTGQKVTLSVAADGTSPFTYQWYKNGTAISSATSASYVISAAATSDAGNYTALVKNSAGSTTSDVAALTVNNALVGPSITSQPGSVTASAGQSATFSVSASGSATLAYQWRKNGSNISGATASTYKIASVATTDAATYSVVVSNSIGSVTSNGATLTVGGTVSAPTITAQPASITVSTGQSASFSVGATGSGLTYQWRKNGTNITNATSSVYTIASAGSTDAAGYSVAIKNSAGSVISNSATLTVSSSPVVQTAKSIWPSTAIPGTVDSGPDTPVQLGVKFRSDVAGTVTGVRFYKASTNTGTHVGNLWSSTGTLLATATFTGESSSGWQQVTFSKPVAINANTVYVASYQTNVGHYSINLDQFANSGVDNAPLHALANGVSGGNGAFVYGSGGFPSQTYRSANYWVDVMFQPSTTSTGTPTPTAASNSVWTSSTVPATIDSGADRPVELGMRFRSDAAGTITAIRFYKSAANTGTHVGNLWTAGGTLLARVTFSGETASGWQQATLSSPVTISANTVYIVSYHSNNGHYSSNENFFSSKGVDSPPLHALADGASGANGLYTYGSSSLFPTQTYYSSNYWVDVVFKGL